MVSPLIDATGFTRADIFNVTKGNFVALAQEIFHFQYQNNAVYREFCDLIGKNKPFGYQEQSQITSQKRLFKTGNGPWIAPFLPISFFKTHRVVSFSGEPQKIFTSSGTTGSEISRHFVPDLAHYTESFLRGFQQFYGEPSQYAFLCLLPSYLEREGSSLIYMAQHLIRLSEQADSGFFLDAGGVLPEILNRREKSGQKTILLGVSFALLDFALLHPMPLPNTIVMETGGMKGRHRELTRAELHATLQGAFGMPAVHSEYGMTELMSQAYSYGNGIYQCPPWMRVFVRDEDDPLTIHAQGDGILCIADLANVYSCSFIETSDVGRVFADGSFEVLGRMDQSDIRGCSLLVV